MALAAPIIPVILLHFLLPESPRWLLTQGRHQEAVKIVRHMAAINGKDLPDHIQIILYSTDSNTDIDTKIDNSDNSDKHSNVLDKNVNTTQHTDEVYEDTMGDGTLLDLMRYPFLRKATLVFFLAWVGIKDDLTNGT